MFGFLKHKNPLKPVTSFFVLSSLKRTTQNIVFLIDDIFQELFFFCKRLVPLFPFINYYHFHDVLHSEKIDYFPWKMNSVRYHCRKQLFHSVNNMAFTCNIAKLKMKTENKSQTGFSSIFWKLNTICWRQKDKDSRGMCLFY